MRLVAWNVNYNGNRRSLEENVSLLRPLGADVLVLSETAAPDSANSLNAHWTGDRNPGLAIIALTGLNLTPHPANAAIPPLMAAYTVSGHVKFDLLTIWPVQRKGGSSYHEILMAALDRYAGVVGSCRAIMAGDCNSSTRVSNQRVTHPLFVKRAESLGLVSAYHEQEGEQHGEETLATYRHNCGPIREFHIDYCFVAKPLNAFVKLRVLNDTVWAERSDHFPLVLDVRDEALTPPPAA